MPGEKSSAADLERMRVVLSGELTDAKREIEELKRLNTLYLAEKRRLEDQVQDLKGRLLTAEDRVSRLIQILEKK